MKARIYRSAKRIFDCKALGNPKLIEASALAVLLKDEHLVVGDFIELEKNNEEYVITERHKRTSQMTRFLPRERKEKVIASNLDLIIVVVSAEKPLYKRGLVDRYLVRGTQWSIPCIVVFNKMDLYEKELFDINFEVDRLKNLGVTCYEISSLNKDYAPRFLELGLPELDSFLKNKTAITLGHSGVGKSKLVSLLSNGRVDLLSGELGSVGKGAHTTTWAELIDCGDFTLIDSPGIRSMSLEDLKSENLISLFPDLEAISLKCKFGSSCKHSEQNKGCAFYTMDMKLRENQMVWSRFEAFERIRNEVESVPDWQKK